MALMGDPGTTLPAAKAFGEDERSVLLGYLAYHRAVLARKAEGITDEDALRLLHPLLTITTQTEDAAEGIAAFAEKRKREWKGR